MPVLSSHFCLKMIYRTSKKKTNGRKKEAYNSPMLNAPLASICSPLPQTFLSPSLSPSHSLPLLISLSHFCPLMGIAPSSLTPSISSHPLLLHCGCFLPLLSHLSPSLFRSLLFTTHLHLSHSSPSFRLPAIPLHRPYAFYLYTIVFSDIHFLPPPFSSSPCLFCHIPMLLSHIPDHIAFSSTLFLCFCISRSHAHFLSSPLLLLPRSFATFLHPSAH